MEAIKIIIADDEELFRRGVSLLLEKQQEFDLIYETNTGKNVIDFLKSANDHPHIILMDINMPELNGVEATKIIRHDFPGIKVIALTSYYSSHFIQNMLHSGASAFLSKNTSPDEMLKTIREVHRKGYHYSDEMLAVINHSLHNRANKPVSRFDANYFTKRELEILLLICQQLSTAEISEKLFISPRTVEGHRNNLLIKTESKNMIGLVIYALENNIVSIDRCKTN